VSDVRLGVHTRSFGALRSEPGVDSIQTLIDALRACDVHECALSATHVEAQFGTPHAGHHTAAKMSPQMMRRELRKWRLRTPASYYRAIGDRFRKAGVAIYAYSYGSDRSFTDQEIDYGFTAARALGADIVTASTTLDVAKRIAPIADRHRMVVALHGRSPGDDPNALGTPQSFAATLQMSKYFKVSLDVGQFTAASLDAAGYLREHHQTITTVLLNDRRRERRDDLPWGYGDTPIREILQLVKREAWPIRVYVAIDYASMNGPIDEVKKCLAYAAQALT